MFDHLMTETQRRVRDEARAFVHDTPRELILDMDAERMQWLREADQRTEARALRRQVSETR